jgi:hypothetical protein
MRTLRRRIALLTVGNAVSLVVALGASALLLVERSHPRVRELDAERINVVGPDGRPRLILADRRLIPGPSMNGTAYPPEVADGRELLSGMIFFNDDGDEVGGLLYNGIHKGDGHSAVGHLSFDQWKQNQVVAIQYVDGGSSRRAGLGVWDRPTDVPMDRQLDLARRALGADVTEREALRREGEAARARGEYGVQRVFVGSRDRVAEVQLRDTRGRVRAVLEVDEHDEARLRFLGADGAVVATYPPPAR